MSSVAFGIDIDARRARVEACGVVAKTKKSVEKKIEGESERVEVVGRSNGWLMADSVVKWLATRRGCAWERLGLMVAAHGLGSAAWRNEERGTGEESPRNVVVQGKKCVLWRRGASGPVPGAGAACKSRATRIWRGLEMGADGLRGPWRFFGCARSPLMMGSGEDTTGQDSA